MSVNSNSNVYASLLLSLDAGKRAVIITRLKQSKNEKFFSTERLISVQGENIQTSDLSIDQEFMDKARESVQTGNILFMKSIDGNEVMIEPYFPGPQLIVMGGGHIAVPLVEFAAKAGFQVTVIDDRPFFANVARFPLAQTVICESFEKSFERLNLNESSFVVVITRGHRYDLLCVREALKHDTAYIGMIGSKRHVNLVFEKILEEGCTPEQIQRVSAPIGVDIGAVTPEEIAVSILAQVIAARRKRKTSADFSPEKFNWPEYDPSVIKELSQDKKKPKAVVTIISTKGSVPRKSGAKMIVFPDGNILGSIGGGCSEGEVIIIARDIIRSGGYKVHNVDLTGDGAEEEGMVCGGTMEVLIEAI